MKKKGLIISTAVMVVVLIAALTTGTFAWFSQTATATIQDVQMNVGASSSVLIGLANKAAGGTSQTDYQSGSGLSYADSKWSGGNNMLGTSIEFSQALALNVVAGVGTSTTDAGSKMDDTLKPNQALTAYYRGAGTEVKSLDLTQATVNNTTNENGSDVIDLQLGVMAAKEEIKNTICKIVISIPTDQLYIGMIAALRLEIKVGTKTYAQTEDSKGDIFGNNKFDTQLSTLSSSTYSVSGNTVFVYYFKINEGDASNKAVTAVSLRAFINGYDEDCCNNATNTQATISIQFDGYKTAITELSSGDTAYDVAKWKELELTAAD